MVITKGDLLDQERKVARSGLKSHFASIEIVSEKNEATYGEIFRRHEITPERFLMVGNSLKSDILPVLALGGAGAHVPYHLMWAAEKVDERPRVDGRYFRLQSMRELPAIVKTLS